MPPTPLKPRGRARAAAADETPATGLRVGIVGCGAIAEQGHLPAFRALGLQPAVLVDPDERRRDTAAAAWGGRAVASVEAAVEHCDAAIVAVPHQLHTTVCARLLAAGVHVLVEKPLATTAAEAQELVALAAASDATLRVAHMRRFLAVNRHVKRLVEQSSTPLQRVALVEGSIDSWDAATDSHLRPETAGGGVVMGLGIHSLDVLHWWLGPLTLLDYADDNAGGLEANAEITLRAASCPEVTIEFSRVRDLRNEVVLEFAGGRVEASLHANTVRATPPSFGARPSLRPQSFEDLFVAQLADWIAFLDGADTALPDGGEAARVVGLIEQCYTQRRALAYPWMT